MNDMVFTVRRNEGRNREQYSNLRRMDYTKGQCLPPCHYTIFSLSYQNEVANNANAEFGRSISITFSHFHIQYVSQIKSCDTTCIIGELGGNLGFFLGGSLVAAFDILDTLISILLPRLKLKLSQ